MMVWELPNRSSSPPTVDNIPCRQTRVAVLLEDGSEWVLDNLMIPLGQRPISFHAAASSLKQSRAAEARGRRGMWRQQRPARDAAQASQPPSESVQKLS
jgi:hypothetical protein